MASVNIGDYIGEISGSLTRACQCFFILARTHSFGDLGGGIPIVCGKLSQIPVGARVKKRPDVLYDLTI